MHVLGIDAGATKTVCYLAGEDGAVVAESRPGGANFQVAGGRGAEKTFQAVMDDILTRHRVLPDTIYVGMAGADREGEGQIVRGILRRIGGKARTLVVNDALPALGAGVGDAPGIVLISGTGSIAYGRSARGVAARAGGWGHLLGNEGSGYWIGLEALRAVACAADGRGPSTRPTSRLLAHFGVSQPSDLIRAARGLRSPRWPPSPPRWRPSAPLATPWPPASWPRRLRSSSPPRPRWSSVWACTRRLSSSSWPGGCSRASPS
jgi:N-acetylglucosamine kinase-like BadF-type ATPase